MPISDAGKWDSNSSSRIEFTDDIWADNPFYYHLSNLSDAAGNGDLPVITPLSFCDLNLTEVYADGSHASLPLLDIDGEIQADLCGSDVYLNSSQRIACDINRGPVVSAILTGAFDEHHVRVLMHGERPAVSVKIERDFRTILPLPAFGAYMTILCRDVNGISYPVGTLGVVRN